MQGDIAFAGFMMTAEEWAALDAPSRALLLAIASPGFAGARSNAKRCGVSIDATSRREPDLVPIEEPWIVVPLSDMDSQPVHQPRFAEGSGGVRSR